MRAFSLEKEPFVAAAPGEFFFTTPALTARLEELCLALGGAHVLLVDEPGSGKTTMLARAVAALTARCRVFAPYAGTPADAKAFTDALVSTFGLPLREPVAAELRDADTFLELLTARRQDAVVVIDDAHLLCADALAQLLYLARRWASFRIRFLIAGEPGLMTRMAALPDDARLPGTAVTFDMPRFDQEQVGDYLHMCLFRAGLVGDSPFDADLVSIVTERARGLVGAIDPVARELLEQVRAEGEHPRGGQRGLSRRWPVAVVAAACLGIVLGIVISRASTPHDEARTHQRGGGFQSGIRPARFDAGSGDERSAAADLVAP